MSPASVASTQCPVQPYDGRDEGQVGESVGEVAQCFPSVAYLFSIQLEVIGVGEHLLQNEPGLIEASSPGEALHQPERADTEGTLIVCGTFACRLSLLALYEHVVGQVLLQSIEGGEPAWICGTDELDHGHEQQRGVQSLGAVVPDEAFLLRIPALAHDLFVDRIPLVDPDFLVGGESPLLRPSYT